ncbi:MAG TPA: cytochrome C [Desulfobacter sp.]|uniref:cytochrome-c peroxidase n=1 Tax=Desulfobacter sp. UBA2225 TaxID=1961413 RepID=UPI000E9311A6|nr:cytochrome c peroxidase [Desulfobacter sp. UBA2225]HAR33359.1 cytochrome C [Desulfobacter sp.]
MKKGLFYLFLMVLLAIVPTVLMAQELSPIEQLGKALFFDENLSVNGKMSCASCHAPETGFTGPDSLINAGPAVYNGTIHTRAGNRKPPTAAYGGESPVLYYDEADEAWVGGMFWDGRATGWVLGDPLAEQAMGPFLNPVEQAAPNMLLIVLKVAISDYAGLFEEVWGPGTLDFKYVKQNTYDVYVMIAQSIAAYERSEEVNPFTSKFDYYLQGQVELTAQEALGLSLFNAEDKGNCAACHPSSGDKPLFTDFTYDNLGVPKNPENPFYSQPKKINPDGEDWVDLGLGGFLGNSDQNGKQKVPTLRNVDKRPEEGFVKAYAHNGFFKSLEEIVHFYNTRDVEAWPDPEVEVHVNTDELGDLGLTAEEEAAIVAFLRTLSDGYTP